MRRADNHRGALTKLGEQRLPGDVASGREGPTGHRRPEDTEGHAENVLVANHAEHPRISQEIAPKRLEDDDLTLELRQILANALALSSRTRGEERQPACCGIERPEGKLA